MEKRKVVFYGAGADAEIKHSLTLKRIGDRQAVAFCDRDPQKQGKLFLGLPVMSFDDAKARFGDFDVYVTANGCNAPAIIAFLCENGVSPERIINYEPVEKSKGCLLADSTLTMSFSGDNLEFNHCCASSSKSYFSAAPGLVLPHTELNDKDISSFFSEKAKIRLARPPQCAECEIYKEASEYHFANFKLRSFTIGGGAPCNFSCHNCINTVVFKKSTYDLWDILPDRFRAFEEAGVIADDCLIKFSPGEPTIGKSYAEVIKQLSKYPLMILTNASIWSEPTAEVLANGHTWLRVSIDAGTRETFKKVKGRDAFDRVCENLKKYAKFGTIVLKYIIFPGLNDNDADFNGFCELADELGAKVEFVHDFGHSEDLPENILEIIADIIMRYQSSGRLYCALLHPNELEYVKATLERKGAPPLPAWGRI